MYKVYSNGNLIATTDNFVQAVWMAQVKGNARINSSYGSVILSGNIAMGSRNKIAKLAPASCGLVMAVVAYLLSR
jgi:hypothetical protein